MRVLIVEDNSTYADLVAVHLSRSGFDSDQAHSVAQAKAATSRLKYAAIILDLGLPDQDGMTLLRDLRSDGDTTPILIVTARRSLEDRVIGLSDGADDYLTKPFSMDELTARLHALLRRPGVLLSNHLLAGNVALDYPNRQLTVGGRVQPARVRELTVLEILMRCKGRVVTRRALEDQLFGLAGNQDTKAIDVYMHRLRRQLIDAGATVTIHNIRGVGYMMSEDRIEQCAS